MSTTYGHKLIIFYKPLFSQSFYLVNPSGFPICAAAYLANL